MAQIDNIPSAIAELDEIVAFRAKYVSPGVEFDATVGRLVDVIRYLLNEVDWLTAEVARLTE